MADSIIINCRTAFDRWYGFKSNSTILGARCKAISFVCMMISILRKTQVGYIGVIVAQSPLNERQRCARKNPQFFRHPSLPSERIFQGHLRSQIELHHQSSGEFDSLEESGPASSTGGIRC